MVPLDNLITDHFCIARKKRLGEQKKTERAFIDPSAARLSCVG